MNAPAKQETVSNTKPIHVPAHPNVHVALAAAQAEMGPLLKGELNPHFKSKYADLAGVVAACREPFARHGLCFHHQTERAEGEWLMVTVLTHGASGTFISCPVPLIVAQNNMQGFKSATTYAKRIGLESVSGLAPEDDDGNDAAKNPPKDRPRTVPEPPHEERADASLAVEIAIKSLSNAETLDALKDIWRELPKPVQHHPDAIVAKDTRKAELTPDTPDDTPLGDELPKDLL